MRNLEIQPGGCDADHIVANDVIVINRGDYLRQDRDYAQTLADAVSSGHSEILQVVTGAERKTAEQAEAVASTEIETGIEHGTKVGYGSLLPSNDSNVICAITPLQEEVHRRLILSKADQLTTSKSLTPSVIVTSLEAAFISLKRGQCGTLYGDAASLRELLLAMWFDKIDYRVPAVWFSETEVSELRRKISDETLETSRQLLERKRKADEEQALAALRTQDEFSEALISKQRSESSMEIKRKARSSELSNEVKDFVSVARWDPASEDADGVAKASLTQLGVGKFSEFTSWYVQQLRDRWELLTFNSDIFDFGQSNWKGRALETVFSKIELRLRNRLLGEYKDACFISAK